MTLKPFFSDAEDAYFDRSGLPKLPGQYEFLRSDGRRVIYTLDFENSQDLEKPGVEPSPENQSAGEIEAPPRPEPRLRVVRASRFEDFPQPAHALWRLEGEWLRFLSKLAYFNGADPSI